MGSAANVSTKAAGRPGYLTLICQGPTAATRRAAFPLDEPLEEGATPPAAHAVHVERAVAAWCSPARAACDSAKVLGLDATVDARLADCHYGRWSGRRLEDVFATEPDEAERWMTDPTAAPHGGESVHAVSERVRDWLAECLQMSGGYIAVTHNTVVRVAVLAVLDAPLRSFWHIDMQPFSVIELSSNGRRWALRVGSI